MHLEREMYWTDLLIFGVILGIEDHSFIAERVQDGTVEKKF